MSPFVRAFTDELVKVALDHGGVPHEGPLDVVLAEALGPIPSAVRGFRRGGALQAAKSGLGYVGGGGLGALGGLAVAKGIQKLTGHDPGIGPLRASTVLPAVAAVLGGLHGEKLAR